MDKFLRPPGLTALDKEIDRLVRQLECTNPVEPDYTTIRDHVKVLCEAREKKNERAISTEALIGMGVNLLGLLFVLNFEKTGVITTKAISMLWRGKQ